MKTELFRRITAIIVAGLFLLTNIPLAEAKLSKKDKKRLGAITAGATIIGLGLWGAKREAAGKPIIGKSLNKSLPFFTPLGTVLGAGAGYLKAIKEGKKGFAKSKAILTGAVLGGATGHFIGEDLKKGDKSKIATGLVTIGKSAQAKKNAVQKFSINNPRIAGALAGGALGAGIGYLSHRKDTDKKTKRKAIRSAAGLGALGGIMTGRNYKIKNPELYDETKPGTPAEKWEEKK